jgi:hypothetical protein
LGDHIITLHLANDNERSADYSFTVTVINMTPGLAGPLTTCIVSFNVATKCTLPAITDFESHYPVTATFYEAGTSPKSLPSYITTSMSDPYAITVNAKDRSKMGSQSVMVDLIDSIGGKNTITMNFDIVNDPPMFTSLPASIWRHVDLTGSYTFTGYEDPNGDPVSLILVSCDDWITVTDFTISMTPNSTALNAGSG